MQSPDIDKLTTALAKAQAEMENAPLNKVNPHFKSKYADLAAIRDATLPVLTKHGLSISQTTRLDGEQFVLVTFLAHASGQYITSVYPLPFSDKPQVMGSAITYARRYSWASMCGVTAEEDDDANAAQEGAKNGTRKPSAQLKRESVWPGFEADLRDVQSVVGLAKLEKHYAEAAKDWPAAWQTQASEAIEKRRDELTASVEDEEIDEAERVRLDTLKAGADLALTPAELTKWAMEKTQQDQIHALPDVLADEFRKHYKARLDKLKSAGRSDKPYAGDTILSAG